jgi:hypothetical protein
MGTSLEYSDENADAGDSGSQYLDDCQELSQVHREFDVFSFLEEIHVDLEYGWCSKASLQ